MRLVWGAVALGATLMLAACGSGPGTASTSATTSTTAASTTTSTAPAPTTTVPATTTTVSGVPTPFVAMQTATGGEFLSPSGNISCEVDFSPTNGAGGALCLTLQPPRSVHMTVDGTLTQCTGVQCLSNAGVGTPTLAYGTETGVGPFHCVSATSGVTCTVTSGKGFAIDAAGITTIG
jgi:hypothetical protein